MRGIEYGGNMVKLSKVGKSVDGEFESCGGEVERRAEGNRRAGERSVRVCVFMALVVGLAVGAVVGGSASWTGSQNAAAQNASAFDDGSYGYGASTDLRESYEANAAPRVAMGANGQARFSRPLEVPPLYAFDSPLDETGRQIILVDSETKRICVYWIRQRGSNSTIELVATRAFELDLKLENFNGEGLTPAQIREQL